MNEVKCSCGAYYFETFWIYGYFDYQTRANYCATCGDKLNPDGTVESREQLVKDKDDAIERGLMAYLDCQEKLLAVVTENEQLKTRLRQEAPK